MACLAKAQINHKHSAGFWRTSAARIGWRSEFPQLLKLMAYVEVFQATREVYGEG